MPNIKEIRERIHSVNATQKLTKTMKLVSSSKLAKAQHQLSQASKYADHLMAVFNKSIAHSHVSALQPYLQPGDAQKRLIIMISTDKGLCGSFNTNIIKQTESYLQKHHLFPEQVDFLAIGKKANSHFKKQDYYLMTTYQMIASQLQLREVYEATDWIIQAFLTNQYSHVELIYNSLETAATHAVQVARFLPFDRALIDDAATRNVDTGYIYEPSQSELLEQMIPLRLSTQLYAALLESNTAEHSARMTAMSKASENATSILKDLRITYNKTRQASITNEILEIAAGAEALRKN